MILRNLKAQACRPFNPVHLVRVVYLNQRSEFSVYHQLLQIIIIRLLARGWQHGVGVDCFPLEHSLRRSVFYYSRSDTHT